MNPQSIPPQERRPIKLQILQRLWIKVCLRILENHGLDAFQPVQPRGVSQQFIRAIPLQIGPAHQIAFPASLQTSHPTPAERVTGWIRVKKVAKEKVRSELLRQFFHMHPETCPPHARMIVEVAGFAQLTGESIHHGDATAA